MPVKPASGTYYSLSFGGNLATASYYTQVCRRGSAVTYTGSTERTKAYCPVAGTIKGFAWNSTNSSASNTGILIKKNGTTITGGTIAITAATGSASLNVAVAAGDYIEIQDNASTTLPGSFLGNIVIEV